jgi:hypothetical protein
VTTDFKIERVKDLKQLRLLLAQDEDGLQEYVYSRLRIGDVWWISDHISGFGERQRHPWIIVRGYSAGRASIVACPRTTKTASSRRGVVTPSGILPDFDQEGLILLMMRRSFVARDFRDFDYVGRLSDRWIRKIQDFYKALAEGRTAR